MQNKMKGKIFTAQEVQAILNKSKVMFREVIKPQPFQSNSTYQGLSVIRDCPYQVGQKIFCKESWAVNKHYDNFDPKTCFAAMGGDVKYCVAYDSNNEFKVDDWVGKKRSARSMPQWASRLTLLIKEIRVERLASISEEDAIAEGVSKIGFHDLLNREQSNGFLSRISGKEYKYYPQEFRKLWNATHKKPEEKFEASPWVWVYQFELIK